MLGIPHQDLFISRHHFRFHLVLVLYLGITYSYNSSDYKAMQEQSKNNIHIHEQNHQVFNIIQVKPQNSTSFKQKKAIMTLNSYTVLV